MGRPGLGELREGLERVLRTDPAKVIGVEVEKAPVVHAYVVYADGNLAEIYEPPRLAVLLVVTVRKLPDNEYARGRIELVTADPRYVAAQVDGFLIQVGRARRKVLQSNRGPEKVFD